ncbi:MAG: hypothetical protein IH624_08540 [Phycisphaerae bacterium]|nr:hypothetical protein [Phycisphaerae bacterium]
MSCDTLQEQTTSDPAPSQWNAVRYVFSALVAGSLCVLIIEPDLAFLGCFIIGCYVMLFVLHAIVVPSLLVNMTVVLIFWGLPFCLIVFQQYRYHDDWGRALASADGMLTWGGMHMLFQSGLWFVFWALRKGIRDDAL